MTKNIKVGDTIVFKTETHVFDDSIFGTYVEPGTIVTIITIHDVMNSNGYDGIPLKKYGIIDATGKCMRVYSIDMDNDTYTII